jgi:hypothetical protein
MFQIPFAIVQDFWNNEPSSRHPKAKLAFIIQLVIVRLSARISPQNHMLAKEPAFIV